MLSNALGKWLSLYWSFEASEQKEERTRCREFAYNAISRISSTICQLVSCLDFDDTDTMIFLIIHTHTRVSHTLCMNPHAHTHEPTYAHTRWTYIHVWKEKRKYKKTVLFLCVWKIRQQRFKPIISVLFLFYHLCH